MFAFLRRLLSRDNESSERAIDAARLPRHIAVIMDGNGRWAQKRGLPRIAGHRAGAKVVHTIVEESVQIGIEFLTLYAFSAENWRRPKKEVGGLMKLFEEILKTELADLHGNNVKILVIGRLDQVAEGTRREFEHAIGQTAGNTGLTLIIALNYGGRDDILRAIKAFAESAASSGRAEPIDEARLSGALSTAGIPDPELIIRTSGELRLSNFLIWESAYAEFWVTDTLWPDFRPLDLREALCDYQGRERRFGGLVGEKTDAG